ncbi:MAG TPA: SDR family oxidoreductase, partial [Anaerolineae bacterium]
SHTIKHPIENLMLSNSIRAAVVGLAKTQSFELAPHGILVNSVGPGVTDTARIRQLFADRAQRRQTTLEQEYAAAAKSIPVGRIGQPEEFANVVVFLASECASFMNGVYLQIDGGEQRTPF